MITFMLQNRRSTELICPKCGTGFISDAKFCNKCGCNLEVEFIETPTCPICRKTFPTGTKFCSEHGVTLASPEKLIPYCEKCGKQYAGGTKFCSDCGGNVRVLLTNQNQLANDFTQTVANIANKLNLISSNSLGMIAATAGVIFFSLFNWVKISIGWGLSINASLFSIVSMFNSREIRFLLGGSTELTLIRIVSVILMIAMLLSFAALIVSMFMKPQSKTKPTLAYSGFGLCAIVTTIFIVVVLYFSLSIEQWILTVFPIFTLAIAILAMKYLIKRPTKNDFLIAAKELQYFLRVR